MRAHLFGRTGKQVPVVGQGTWQMEGNDRASCVAALRRGLDLGMTHVDTAEIYGRTKVEELIVREAIAGRRDEVFLVSKVRPDHATRFGTVEACGASLKRLGTDHLDCYLLHWPGAAPLSETIAAFESLEKAGKIRSWGVSNFDIDDLEEAESLAGKGRIACNQVLYHLQDRGIEKRVVPWCEARGIAVVGYSPFGGRRGFPAPSSPGGKLLAELATAHGVTARAIVVAFLARRPSLFAIPKHSSAAHAEDNAKAGELSLSDAELARIDAAFAA